MRSITIYRALLKFTTMSTSIISEQPKGDDCYPFMATFVTLTDSCTPSTGHEPTDRCKGCLWICCPVALGIDAMICPCVSVWCIGKKIGELFCESSDKQKKQVVISMTTNPSDYNPPPEYEEIEIQNQ